MGVAASCCGAVLLQEELVLFIKWTASQRKNIMLKYLSNILSYQQGSWSLGQFPFAWWYGGGILHATSVEYFHSNLIYKETIPCVIFRTSLILHMFNVLFGVRVPMSHGLVQFQNVVSILRSVCKLLVSTVFPAWKKYLIFFFFFLPIRTREQPFTLVVFT